jgi:hypothetical protein
LCTEISFVQWTRTEQLRKNVQELVKVFVEIPTQTDHKLRLGVITSKPVILGESNESVRYDVETQTFTDENPRPQRLMVRFLFRGIAIDNPEIAFSLARSSSIIWCEVSVEGRRLLAAGRTHATVLDEQQAVRWNDTVELNCSYVEASNLIATYKIWTIDQQKQPILLAETRQKLETTEADAFITMEPSSVRLVLGPVRAHLIAK